LFPRHDFRDPQVPGEIRISCLNPDLKKTGIVICDTGKRTIVAGILVLAGMAAYAQYPGAPAPAGQMLEQKMEKKAVPVETHSGNDRKIHPARHVKSRNYSRQVHTAGSRHNIDPRLIHAVIEVESRGDPNAVSPRGAKGLMQITPGICKRYGVSNPFDIEQNINAGSAYLAHLLESLNGDLERALAAYNCGLGRASTYKELPPLSETRLFVNKIISRYKSIMLKDLTGQGHPG